MKQLMIRDVFRGSSANTHNFTKCKTPVADKNQRQQFMLAACIALMAVIASVTGLNAAQTN